MAKLFMILIGSVLMVSAFTLYGYWRIGKLPIYPKISGIAVLTENDPHAKNPSRLDFVKKNPHSRDDVEKNPHKRNLGQQIQNGVHAMNEEVHREKDFQNAEPMRHEMLKREANSDLSEHLVEAKQMKRRLKNVAPESEDDDRIQGQVASLHIENGKHLNKSGQKDPASKANKRISQKAKTKGHVSTEDFVKSKGLTNNTSETVRRENYSSSKLKAPSIKVRERYSERKSARIQSERDTLNVQPERGSVKTQSERDSVKTQAEKKSVKTQAEKGSVPTKSDRNQVKSQSERGRVKTQSERDSVKTQRERDLLHRQTDPAKWVRNPTLATQNRTAVTTTPTVNVNYRKLSKLKKYELVKQMEMPANVKTERFSTVSLPAERVRYKSSTLRRQGSYVKVKSEV